jgi:hypothetical protein
MNIRLNYSRMRRLLYAALKKLTGGEPPDVVKVLQYRPEFFGKAASAEFQRVMRGESIWTPGERELMAAAVSSWNKCPF